MRCFILLLSLLSHPLRAADYSCAVEFGETVPIRKIVGETTETWNEAVESDPKLKSKVKRRTLHYKGQTILLDTRYAIRQGTGFDLRIECPRPSKAVKKASKCSGSFINKESPLRLETSIFNLQGAPSKGYAEISMTDREHLNMIVRVFKETASDKVSSSGELKIFREDPSFIQDVGVDEQLPLIDDFSIRIAALEIKIRCDRKDSGSKNGRVAFGQRLER